MSTCKSACYDMIESIVECLKEIDEKDYGRSLELFEGSSLGKHFRHIYNFFYVLIEARDDSILDYRVRYRDPKLECDLQCSYIRFEGLKKQIIEIDSERQLAVYPDIPTVGAELEPVRSTMGRELMFAYDHAVHHLAMIRIGLRALYPEKSFASDLGVAASTVTHQNKNIER